LKNRDMVGSINIMKKGLGDLNPLFSRQKVPWKKTTPRVHVINPQIKKDRDNKIKFILHYMPSILIINLISHRQALDPECLDPEPRLTY
jgi:hypothetical protein